jgi:hypothetical protein
MLFGLNNSSRPSGCIQFGFLILTQYGDGFSVDRYGESFRFATTPSRPRPHLLEQAMAVLLDVIDVEYP